MNTSKLLQSATIALAALLLSAASTPCLAAATYPGGTTPGSGFSPSGSDFTLFGVQGLAPDANPAGTPNPNAVVNIQFEGVNTFGVSYTGSDPKNPSKLTDFGIGLYQSGSGKTATTAATGLEVAYNQLVTGVNLTIGDFDLKGTEHDFLTGKVAPSVTVFGAGGISLGTANPGQVFSNMTFLGNFNGVDEWNLNVGGLLTSLGDPSNTGVSGVLLSASAKNIAGQTEKSPSDPYVLIAAGNGIPQVPEPSSALLILGTLGTAVVASRRRRAKASPVA